MSLIELWGHFEHFDEDDLFGASKEQARWYYRLSVRRRLAFLALSPRAESARCVHSVSAVLSLVCTLYSGGADTDASARAVCLCVCCVRSQDKGSDARLPWNSNEPWYDPGWEGTFERHGINAGVLLLNLERMRATGWLKFAEVSS